MSDRESLLAAIRQFPSEDVPRLAYADWLDGLDAPTDLDRATAEFVRLSCDCRGGLRMPRAVYPWLLSKGEDGRLVENWKRLLPSVLAVDAAHGRPGDETVGVRRGRAVSCSIAMPRRRDDPTTSRVKLYSFAFVFDRGFVSRVECFSAYAAGVLLEALYRDQPLVSLDLVGLNRAAAEALAGRVRAVMGEAAAARLLRGPLPW